LIQGRMESKHGIMYSVLVDTLIVDEKRKHELYNSFETIPVIKRIADYIRAIGQSRAPLPVRMLQMACAEGIIFSGCFCFIFWLAERGLLPGLVVSNELISRDEGLHTEFALFLYNLMKPEYKLTMDEIHSIFDVAVGLACDLMIEAMKLPLPEMSADLIGCYIKNQADNMLFMIHTRARYNIKHDLRFMDLINMKNKTNFFEHRVTEYSGATMPNRGTSASQKVLMDGAASSHDRNF